MSVTLKEIAELAGVSVGTVSKVLNNKGRIGTEVSEKIRRITRELDYQPNSLAISLSARKRTRKIAVILHVMDNYVVSNLVKGINAAEKELKESGIEVSIRQCPDYDSDRQLALLDQAVEEHCDGIIIIPINSDKIRNRINELYEQQFPVILLTSMLEHTNYLAYVGRDYKKAGLLSGAVVDLLGCSKKDIAIFIPNKTMLSNDVKLDYMLQRLHENKNNTIGVVSELPNDEIHSYLSVKQCLDAYPAINTVIYATSATQGGLQAVLEAEKKRRLMVVTTGMNEMTKKGFKEGLVQAAVVEKDFFQGTFVMKVMAEHLINGSIKRNSNFFSKSEILLKENVEDFENELTL
ncbi:MAG: LacI family transcriptional regulator [Spirochaetia bacterium]|jgi:LacI family transcriptional regulator|nr:LacI family transcriptional regulator [Spirochaetia bacterium]